LVGEITYRYRFPNTPLRKSKFCYMVSDQTVDPSNFRPHAALCSHLNCEDEECKEDKRAYDAAVAKEPTYKYFRATVNTTWK